MTIIDQENITDEAFEMALKMKITFYDTLYTALSKEEAILLVTRGRKQVRRQRMPELKL